MRGCQDGSLKEWEERELLYVRDSHGFRTYAIEDIWHVVEIDPVEVQQERDDLLAYCARNGRQSIAEMEQMSVIRFNEIALSISRQIERENEAAKQSQREAEAKW